MDARGLLPEIAVPALPCDATCSCPSPCTPLFERSSPDGRARKRRVPNNHHLCLPLRRSLLADGNLCNKEHSGCSISAILLRSRTKFIRGAAIRFTRSFPSISFTYRPGTFHITRDFLGSSLLPQLRAGGEIILDLDRSTSQILWGQLPSV